MTVGGCARLCVAVLAAGAARRMGASKLTMPLAGTTPLALALGAACGCADVLAGGPAGARLAGGGGMPDGVPVLELARKPSPAFAWSSGLHAEAEVVVVTGAHRDEVRRSLAEFPGVRELVNPLWESGQASSVRVAAGHAMACGFDALLVLVGDQPLVRARHLLALVASWLEQPGAADAWRAAAGERRGSPCLFSRRALPELLRLEGDEGARALFRARPDLRVRDVDLGDALLFEDVDTPGDAARVEAELLARAVGFAVGQPTPRTPSPCELLARTGVAAAVGGPGGIGGPVVSREAVASAGAVARAKGAASARPARGREAAHAIR